MSKTLDLYREYTWGDGGFVYELTRVRGVYCHTTNEWLSYDASQRHKEEVWAYPLFRYIDKEDVPASNDGIRNPVHYQVFPDVESIEIIARSMTQAEFKGFCMGNVLKYRLRAGKKSELATMEKDLKKADFYKELFEQHKDKCYA